MKHQYLAERVVPDGWIRDRYDWDVNEGEGYIERKIPSNSYGSSYHFTVHESGELGLMHPTYIYRKVWEYPEWLGGAGVYCDEFGVWFVSSCKPYVYYSKQNGWRWHVGGESHHAYGHQIYCDLFPHWTPPPCDDWTKSWHPNPRAGK